MSHLKPLVTCLLVATCFCSRVSSQEFFFEQPSLGIGNNSNRKNAQGKIFLGLNGIYVFDAKIGVGIEGIVGGNLFSGGITSKNQDTLIINPESLNFNFIGLSNTFKVMELDNSSFILASASFGLMTHTAKNIGLQNNEDIRQRSFGANLKVAYSFNEFKIGLQYTMGGTIDGFVKVSDNQLPAIMDSYRVQMIFLCIGYRLALIE